MPNWDIRFLKMAEMVSLWSKDTSTKTGAVIVRPDHSVASLVFNGFRRVCLITRDGMKIVMKSIHE